MSPPFIGPGLFCVCSLLKNPGRHSLGFSAGVSAEGLVEEGEVWGWCRSQQLVPFALWRVAAPSFLPSLRCHALTGLPPKPAS